METVFRIAGFVLFLAFFSLLVSESNQSAEDELKGLKIGIMKKPKRCPKESQKGDTIRVRFNGTLLDGQVIAPQQDEFTFTLGDGVVIKAWDMGLLDMCVGELRELVIPPSYGYGDLPVGDKVPPKQIIVFYIEMLGIESGSGKQTNTFVKIDQDGDGMISQEEAEAYLSREGFPDGRGEESHKALLHEIFREEDKDNDGYITFNEFQGLKHRDEL